MSRWEVAFKVGASSKTVMSLDPPGSERMALTAGHGLGLEGLVFGTRGTPTYRS